MTDLLRHIGVIALAVWSFACGDAVEAPQGALPRPDAGVPADARPDTAPPVDARPDAPCDDGDPALTQLAVLYPDHDGDGVGAPPRQITCIGTTVPDGPSRGGYDDDDSDPDIIEDEDSNDLLELLLLES